MGNIEAHDLAPVRDDERKECNLSRKVTYKQYVKHLQGDFSEACMLEWPWNIRDAVSLYERFDASFHRLPDIPPELPLRLPHLHYINLSHNQITEIPESFALLFHLRTVLLNNNAIKKIPMSFIHLVKLEKLDVSHNILRELPETMGTMESLQRLNVSHNKLKTLPLSLGNSKIIKVIMANNNRLETPPQSLCDSGSEATIKHLRKICPKENYAKPTNVKVNVFKRVRGNQLLSSTVPNPQSAQTQYIQQQTYTSNTVIKIKTPLLPPLGSSQYQAYELRDKIVGLIYGAAIGDAIGIATEFMSRDECLFHYDVNSLKYTDIVRDQHRVHWKQGDWTGDFDQCVLVLDSLLHWGGVIDELDFAKRLDEWYYHGFPELKDVEGFTLCNTIVKAVNDPSFLSTPYVVADSIINFRDCHISDKEKESCEEFADNGSLTRCLMLAIPHFHNIDEVVANTVRITKATHADDRCIASAVTIATMLALMLQGQHISNVDELINAAKQQGLKYLTDIRHIKDFEEYCSYTDLNSLNVTEPERMSFTFKPLGAAVVSLRETKDFRCAVSDLLMCGGDSNTNCCVTGALLGCKVGFASLPMEWVEGIRPKQKDWLNEKINLLLDMMGIP
ncbi:unnamed protein product [Owenia fusiformis]|uniref:Disease resistance R13L4/SHOC-2-like LRR domain-containing protein n=1 Tax=Owenia fusiformis TaxID=6347 RepID=A0A8J1TG56_OWEFU|nr:unnamed protein product [Owenia fusiformis]